MAVLVVAYMLFVNSGSVFEHILNRLHHIILSAELQHKFTDDDVKVKVLCDFKAVNQLTKIRAAKTHQLLSKSTFIIDSLSGLPDIGAKLL